MAVLREGSAAKRAAPSHDAGPLLVVAPEVKFIPPPLPTMPDSKICTDNAAAESGPPDRRLAVIVGSSFTIIVCLVIFVILAGNSSTENMLPPRAIASNSEGTASSLYAAAKASFDKKDYAGALGFLHQVQSSFPGSPESASALASVPVVERLHQEQEEIGALAARTTDKKELEDRWEYEERNDHNSNSAVVFITKAGLLYSDNRKARMIALHINIKRDGAERDVVMVSVVITSSIMGADCTEIGSTCTLWASVNGGQPIQVNVWNALKYRDGPYGHKYAYQVVVSDLKLGSALVAALPDIRTISFRYNSAMSSPILMSFRPSGVNLSKMNLTPPQASWIANNISAEEQSFVDARYKEIVAKTRDGEYYIASSQFDFQ